MIQPVESLEITVLVDNGTDSLSTNPGFVETEMAGAWRRGMKWLSGRCLCCAAHGLSPSSQHTLLFGTGPDESIFVREAFAAIDAAAPPAPVPPRRTGSHFYLLRQWQNRRPGAFQRQGTYCQPRRPGHSKG